MPDKEGWIKLHRQIEDNEFYFAERFTKIQAWMDLLLLANHKANMFYVRGNEIKLKEGQTGWSIQSLGRRWQWNQRTVTKYLRALEKRQMIQVEISNITTIITIINWKQYQGHTEQNTEQNTGQMQNRIHTNKNDKNVKNEKNNPAKAVSKSLHNSLKKIFIDFYNQFKKPNTYYWSAKDAGQIKNIISRIKSGATLTDEQVIIALKRLLWSIPDKGWLWDNLSPSLIVSKWNEINAFANEKDRAGLVKTEIDRSKELKATGFHSGKAENLTDILSQIKKT